MSPPPPQLQQVCVLVGGWGGELFSYEKYQVFRIKTPISLHSAITILHPLFFTLSASPSLLHFQSYTLCSTPSSLHPIFFTLNHTPFTLHPLTWKKPFLFLTYFVCWSRKQNLLEVQFYLQGTSLDYQIYIFRLIFSHF